MAKPGSPTPFFSMGLPTPQPMVTRPLLGIDWMNSPVNLKPGALLDAQGLVVRPRGLYHIPGYESAMGEVAWSPADNPLLLAGAWGVNGIQYPYLFTENYVFLASGGFTREPWTYTVGTITTTGANVATTSGTTLWKTLGVLPGDLITIAGTTYVIQTVTSDTALVLTTSAGSNVGVAYSISRLNHAGTPYMVDGCQATDITLGPMYVFATFNQQLGMLTPSTGVIANLTATVAKQPSTGGFTAECVAYFAGRIFAGHLNDGSNGELRQFLRWSKATDITDFSDPTAYNNLLSNANAFAGAIRRLVSLGTVLVVYADDAIFIGTPSNTANLPLSFQQIPTSGIGLAGPRAIASIILPREETNLWGTNISGHFFVGPDNVYFLSASSLTLQPIGSKIVKNSITQCQYPYRIQAAIDWTNRRVRFGFPKANSYIENVYDFDWETKEWSYESRKTWLLGDPFLSYELTYTYMVTVTGNNMVLSDNVTDMIAAWSAAPLTSRAIYIEQSGTLWSTSGKELATNPDGSSNALNVMTQDFDEGAPGMVKFWRMLRLKIAWDTAPSVDIAFNIGVSLDLGQTFRVIGTLTIRQGETEGWINFRATGPHIRFQIASVTPVTPYYIVELTRLVSMRGTQGSNRQQHALP